MSGKKIVVAITGASGSVYADVLLQKLAALKNQIAHVGIVMSDNAKLIWKSERTNESWNDYGFAFYNRMMQ
jgi:flavin prenyltransferase